MASAADATHCRYNHEFDPGNPAAERGARAVIALSLFMMIAEIAAGLWFGSMALLADGWHMATHVAAIGIAAGAYFFARHYARDTRFAFGTWKIEVLGGFTSAIVLGLVALGMSAESLQRLWHPQVISYRESLLVATLGLAVNLLSVWFLHDGHGGHAGHETHDAEGERCKHAHHGSPHHHDVNLRAAWMHVVADAMTSILAIAALTGAWWLGWVWLDPATGIVGSVVIGWWSVGLARNTGRILLDCEMDHPVVRAVRELAAATPGVEICDLHLWRVGRNKYACIVSILVSDLRESEAFRQSLGEHPELGHITIEVFGRSEPAARQIVESPPDR